MSFCPRYVAVHAWLSKLVGSRSFVITKKLWSCALCAAPSGRCSISCLSSIPPPPLLLPPQGAHPCPGSCKKLFEGQTCYTCHYQSERRPQDVSYAIDLGNAVSPAGEDVVPTFTTSNDRMLLLLSSGQSGMLRCEDAERLQVTGWAGGGDGLSHGR